MSSHIEHQNNQLSGKRWRRSSRTRKLVHLWLLTGYQHIILMCNPHLLKWESQWNSNNIVRMLISWNYKGNSRNMPLSNSNRRNFKLKNRGFMLIKYLIDNQHKTKWMLFNLNSKGHSRMILMNTYKGVLISIKTSKYNSYPQVAISQVWAYQPKIGGLQTLYMVKILQIK